jgi:hypothetical protein
MRNTTHVILFMLCLLLPVSAQRVGHERTDAYAVMDEVARMAARASLWPGFDPRRVPVEIYDGRTTLLFGHPSPPSEFVSLSSRQGVWAFAGRHETVTANAHAKLNGVWTATVMLDRTDRLSLRERAGLVVHETFHVFQRERHPDWLGNELELFTYPFEDAQLLALRRVETEALRRAERAAGRVEAACWARVAIERRRERFARLSEGAIGYERALELNEGLARYVESRAAGVKVSDLSPQEFAADEIRKRGYATGHALALLLSRFAPTWTTRVEAERGVSLDHLLAEALPPAPPRAARCNLPASFETAARRRAEREVAALVARRDSLRREFESQPGWKLVVEADTSAPLWPQGFDPLNVQRVGAASVLHTRHLKLGNDAGAIEILDRHALTEGAGAHPLFNGVRRMTLGGLDAEPSVQEAGGKVTLSAGGVKAEFRGARIERAGRTFTLRLGQPAK